jgi:hypothetical protein
MHRISLLGLSALALMSVSGTAFAADQDFTIKNRTGYQIDDVYISKHSSSEWGDDVLGHGAVIEDGDSSDITFRERARGCHWDLKVQYHDETTAEWADLNLCEISTVTLHYDRKSGVTRATTD